MTLNNSKKEDYYELLRLSMDKWPTRTPKSPDIRKILKELYTEEEAELLSNFKGPFIDMATPLEIAQRSGKPEERTIEIFNSLAERGLLFKMGIMKTRPPEITVKPFFPPLPDTIPNSFPPTIFIH